MQRTNRVAFDRHFASMALACLALFGSLGGCSKSDKSNGADASQVVAQVNGGEISIHQVQTMMEMQPALTAQLGQSAPTRMLDSLIEQELAAQAARKAGLDSSPRVVQAMELAKREILARAYQDQLVSKVPMPDSQAIDEYYDAHPELFAQRHQYVLQETRVKVTGDQAQTLLGKLDALSSVEALNALVSATNLPHSSRNSSQWPEAIPTELLKRLFTRKNGQSIGVQQPDGVLILTLVGGESAPLLRGQAVDAIKQALWNGRRKELVQKGMNALHEEAKIQRFGNFAAPASSASAASAS